jgi:hypothetical protein
MSTNPDRSRASAFGLIREREQSGSFPIGGRAEDNQRLESDLVIAEIAPELVSMIPEPPLEARRNFAPPRHTTPSERAELVIEDLSMQLDNPYLASSLVPPPKRPVPMRRALAIGAGMLAAAAIGALIQLSVLRSAHQTEVNAGAAGIAAPAPVAAVGAVASAQPPAAPREVPAIAPQPEPAVSVLSAPIAAAPADHSKVDVAAAQPDQSKADVAAPQPAARVRVARIAPPAPPEPSVPVAEAAIPSQAAPAADLPEYPTREQVTAGFESVRAALSQCAAGRSGRIEIKATIASTGRIAHALVGGDFKGSVEGSCMARAVREAQFPAFSQARLKVSYPIAL